MKIRELKRNAGITNEEEIKEIQTKKDEITQWSEGLVKMAKRIRCHFASSPGYERAVQYLKGLLSHVERKNGWQLSEVTGDNSPYGIQNLLNRVNWDANAVRDDLQSYVTENTGDEEGIFILDETGFLKKGKKSVGVQRQYTGTAGGITNCQIGVFLGYTTLKGRTLIDRELYIPESWIEDKERCREAGIPEDINFKTKPELAKKMLKKAFDNGVPGKWITGDEVYGNNSSLRNWIELEKHPYVMTVSCDTLVDTGFEYSRADNLGKNLSDNDWKRLSAGEGSKGHRWFDWAIIQIYNMQAPEGNRYVLFRRNIEDLSDIAYYLVFSPQKTSLEEIVHVAGSRWTIESCFETAKSEVGLDQYEVRTWQGWYHHITLALFAQAFLSVLCIQINRQEAKKGDTIARISSMTEFRKHRKVLSR